jgi:hypothetical protein
MQVFNNFPHSSSCPICGTSTNGQTILVPIDDSKHNDGKNEEAIPTHLMCILTKIRYSKEHKLMGLEASNGE